MAFATIQQKRPKCWKICDIRYCRLSAPTGGFGIAEFSVTEARSGLVMIQKQLNITKMRERESERKREENSLKHWYVNQSALTEGLGNP